MGRGRLGVCGGGKVWYVCVFMGGSFCIKGEELMRLSKKERRGTCYRKICTVRS